MQLDENWSIISKPLNIVLRFSEPRVNAKGEAYISTKDRYYPSVKLALRGYLDMAIEPQETYFKLFDHINAIYNNVAMVAGSLEELPCIDNSNLE